jgi:hypothetical protein
MSWVQAAVLKRPLGPPFHNSRPSPDLRQAEMLFVLPRRRSDQAPAQASVRIHIYNHIYVYTIVIYLPTCLKPHSTGAYVLLDGSASKPEKCYELFFLCRVDKPLNITTRKTYSHKSKQVRQQSSCFVFFSLVLVYKTYSYMSTIQENFDKRDNL